MVLHATCLLLVLLCSQLAASFVPSQSHAANGITDLPPAVRDMHGQELIPRARYYVLPVLTVSGGLTIGVRRVGKCPLYVTQAPFEIQRGLPMTFTPVNSSSDEFVRVSTDLNVQFSDIDTLWKLGREEKKRYFVSIDGDKGSSGPETMNSWFKIERREGEEEGMEYKFAFFPGVWETCRPCGDLGWLSDEDGNTLLGLGSDQPLYVVFMRADDWTSTYKNK